MRWTGTRGGVVAAGVLVAIACGRPGSLDGADVKEVASTAARMLAQGDAGAAPAAKALGDGPVAETARLAAFWAAGRLAEDGGDAMRVKRRYDWELLAKAAPDECFLGVGVPPGRPDASGRCAAGTPKVNDAYVWGLTRVDKTIFFGTIANTHCLVEGAYLGLESPQVTSEWVCELGPNGTSDFRPPHLFAYDLARRALISLDPPFLGEADLLRRATTGLRSAATIAGIVFLAGPSALPSGGVNVFALDGATGELLGADTVGAGRYTNVRQWVLAKGALYVGVGTTSGGAVLRWMGDRDHLFDFEEVGHLPGDAANMTLHEDGRIYVTTWPRFGGTPSRPVGLYRSPVIPAGGLTAADADAADWSTPLWLAAPDGVHQVPAYDPDPLTGRTVAGGAIASLRGHLVFGTMSVPFLAAEAATRLLGLPAQDLLRTALGTHRSVAVFDVDTQGGTPRVSMLYGERHLPVFDPARRGYTIRLDRAHRTGFEPRFGASGLGSFFNTYVWSAVARRDEILVGTFDWSQLARVELQALVERAPAGVLDDDTRSVLRRAFGASLPREGADLIRFSAEDGVVAESVSGLGNDRNYGIRNMITDGKTVWVGTANPMNLDPRGGWELIQLTPRGKDR